MTNIEVGAPAAPQAEKRTHKLWGGRFGAGPTPEFDALNNSIGVDFRLWPYDVRLSKAWAVALWGAGVLTLEESKAIERGLDAVASRLEAGEQPLPSDEDVHTLIDRLLHEEVGDVASQAAHGSQPQRPGVHGRAAVDDRRVPAARRRPAWLQQRDARAGAHPRDGADAVVHAPAARHPGVGRALAALAFLAARARSCAASRGAPLGGRPSAGLRRGGWMRVSDLAHPPSGDARLRRTLAELDRRRQRPRLHRRGAVRRDDDRHAPLAARRRPHHLRVERVRVRAVRRGLHVGLEHDAAEAEPRRAGARARLGGAHARQPHDAARHAQGAAVELQQGPAGRQARRCSTRPTRCCSCCPPSPARSASVASVRSACVPRSRAR